MKLLVFLLLFHLTLFAATAELPKDLRIATEMIQDGLGRDAASRISAWLEKNSSTPQPEAQLLLAEALLLDYRPNEALTALPKSYPVELNPRYRTTRAAALSESGRWKEALAAWQEAQKESLTPAMANQVRLGLINSWLQLNNNTEATRELNEILAEPKNPFQDTARLLLVKILLSEGKSEDASDALAKISPKSPPSILAEATYWKARLLSVRGKADEARALFEQVIEEGKNATRDLVTQAWIAIGQIDRAREKPADAALAFEKALDRGGEPESYLTAAREYLASAKSAQSLPTASLRLRDSVRDRESDDEKRGRYAPALLLLAASALDSGNAEAAIADLDSLMKTYPTSPALPAATLLLAEALVKQGQPAVAREKLEALLLRQNLLPEILYQGQAALANLLLQEGKASESSALWEKAATSAPDPNLSEQAYFNAALAAARQPDPATFGRLEELFTKKYPESSRRAALALERGRMLESKGDSPASRSALAEVSKLPGSESLKDEAALRRASSLLRTGDYPGAINAFAEFEKSFPKSNLLPQALASGIEARLRQRELTGAQARSEFAKILARFPESSLAPSLAFQIGQTHYEDKNHGEALSSFREMAAKFPKDPLADDALYYAGLSALALGNPEEAVKLFRALPETSPLRLDARLAEIDASRTSGDYPGGLQIANSLLANKTPDQRAWVEITKRRLACEFAIGGTDRASLERATSTASALIASPAADAADRNEAGYIRGKSLEQLGREEDALQAYLDVLYAKQSTPSPGTAQPEYLWFARAGAEAARLQEKKGDFRGALAIYRILENAGGPSQLAFTRKIEDLRNRHFLWSEQ
jgi:TolA-binding protein